MKRLTHLTLLALLSCYARVSPAQEMTAQKEIVQHAVSVQTGSLHECPIEFVQSSAWLEGAEPEVSFQLFDGSHLSNEIDLGQYQAVAPANVFLNNPFDIVAVEVELQGLLGDATRLEGEYVRAGSERLDGFDIAAPGLNGADFRFEPDTTDAQLCNTDQSVCSRFDAVNVYYHIDTFVREFWIDRMGVDINFQTDARVHIGGDGAFAQPAEYRVGFKVGNIFNKNAALSNDFIYHEYSHLVAYSLGFEVTSSSDAQTLALGEAYADYFAATYTGSPRIGDWVVTCPDRQLCEGRENDNELRTLDIDKIVWNWNLGLPQAGLQYGFCLRYHELDQKCKASYTNTQPQYVWGMIWGAMLWDLRDRIGADATDRLTVEAIRRHGPTADFQEAIMDLHAAENALFGGLHTQTLNEVLAGRGFPPSSVGVDEEPGFASLYELKVWPNPVSGVVHIAFESSSPFRSKTSSRIQISDITGRTVRSEDLGWLGSATGELTLNLSDLSAGVYVVSLFADGTWTRQPLVIANR